MVTSTPGEACDGNATANQDDDQPAGSGRARAGAFGAASAAGKRPISSPGRSPNQASYATFDDAEGAGLAIKKGYPIVQVSVYDATDAVNKIIELPAKE
jgi:hypothetical protein